MSLNIRLGAKVTIEFEINKSYGNFEKKYECICSDLHGFKRMLIVARLQAYICEINGYRNIIGIMLNRIGIRQIPRSSPLLFRNFQI